MFDANTLFQRLCLEAEDRKMLRCGNALCLKPISVKGSHCKMNLIFHLIILDGTKKHLSHILFFFLLRSYLLHCSMSKRQDKDEVDYIMSHSGSQSC